MEQHPLIPFDVLEVALLDSNWYQVKCVCKRLYQKYISKRELTYLASRERLGQPLGYLKQGIIFRLHSLISDTKRVVLVSRTEAEESSKELVYQEYPKVYDCRVHGVKVRYSVCISIKGISWSFGSPTKWLPGEASSLMDTLKHILG